MEQAARISDPAGHGLGLAAMVLGAVVTSKTVPWSLGLKCCVVP